MKRKRVFILLGVIAFLVICVKLNPIKLDFIKYIRSKDLNIKFPMVKNEDQEYTAVANFKIFTIYKFFEIEHIDAISQDTTQIFITDYNGRFKKTTNTYLGILNNFIKIRSEDTSEK